MPSILNTEQKILKAINKFSKYKRANHRYASFDYCYSYFFSFKDKKIIASDKYLEKSCLHLVSYLASWGMYRGSSYLLREKSIKFFEKLIKWIAKCPQKYWEIDVDNYNEENIATLLDIYSKISKCLGITKKRSPVLVTKIMLGVFGNTPAYDENFRKTFSKYYKGKPGFTSFNKPSLEAIRVFYSHNENSTLIDKLHRNCKTFNFQTGRLSRIKYTRAKIIDMIGFGHSYKPKKKK